MRKYRIGIDIGGTKTAVVLGDSTPAVYKRIQFPTDTVSGPDVTIQKIIEAVSTMIDHSGREAIEAVGISCGGPLDSSSGVILSPPNLPGWDAIPISAIINNHFNLPVFLQNDANACALAEWKWGAGKGCRNMIFMTFGTGLGAGMILNGQLYSGENDMAGEIGHVRLEHEGPVGYGKRGSFEGFCSGGGLAQLAENIIFFRLEKDMSTPFCKEFSSKKANAKDVCQAAEKGDPAAREILEVSGKNLGKGLSLLIDILNPERIVIGSIFTRCQKYLFPAAESVIEKEALKVSAAACRIFPSALGEQIGDFGSLCVAENYAKNSIDDTGR